MTDKIEKSTVALALATMVISKLGLKYLDRQELKANKKQLSEKLAKHPDFVEQIQAAKSTEELVEVGESILPRLEQRAQVKKEDKIEKILDDPEMSKLAGGLAIITVGYFIDAYSRRLGMRTAMKVRKRELIKEIKKNPKFIKEVTEAYEDAKGDESIKEIVDAIGMNKLIKIAAEEAKKLEGSKVEKGVIMKEDLKQREMRLKKELAKVRSQNAADNRKATVSRDYSIGGLPPDTTHKPINASNDVPDVVLLPSKKRGKKENIPF